MNETSPRAAHASDGDSPVVSVLISTYNHARFVGDAIASVLRQTYQRFEIIVVDDGSTDDTRSVVAKFGDRVRYFYQENRGLATARNLAMRVATGRIVGLLDADDMYEPEFLATLVAMLEADPEAGAAYCGYRHVDEANHSLPQVEARVIAPAQFHDTMVRGNFVAVCSVLVRRSCYDRIGDFDPAVDSTVDWDTWLRLSRHCRFIGTAAVLVRYRVISTSLSTDLDKTLQHRLRILQKYFGPLAARPPSDTQRYAYARTYLIGVIEQLHAGNSERAYECVVRMADSCPEILCERGLFYELGCGAQPRGFRGDFASIDLDQSSRWLTDTLDRLFDDPRVSQRLRRYRRQAYGNAHFALAQLSYGARRMPEARHHLWRAVRANPRAALDHLLLSTLLRSLLRAAAGKYVRRSADLAD